MIYITPEYIKHDCFAALSLVWPTICRGVQHYPNSAAFCTSNTQCVIISRMSWLIKLRLEIFLTIKLCSKVSCQITVVQVFFFIAGNTSLEIRNEYSTKL